jgi:hypothetical protein
MMIFINCFSNLNPVFIYVNSYEKVIYLIFLSCVVASMGWEIRRFKELGQSQKVFLMATVMLILANGLFSASKAHIYLLYFFPWFLIHIAYVLKKIYTDTFHLDKDDVVIFSLSSLTVIAAQVAREHRGTMLLLIGFFLLAIRFLFSAARKNSTIFICGMVYTILLLMTCLDSLLVLFLLLFRTYPWVVNLMILILPWCLFKAYATGIGLRFIPRIRSRIVFSSFFLVISLVTFIFQLTITRDYFKREEVAQRFSERLTSIPDKRRILGPAFIPIYQPSLSIQSELALHALKDFYRDSYNVIPIIRAYNPTYMLISKKNLDYFGLISASNRNPHEFVIGSPLDTPWGIYHEIKYSKIDTIAAPNGNRGKIRNSKL